MKNFLFINLLLLHTVLLFSQNYSVENIPEDLKKNAGSVVRFDQMIFTVESRSKAKLYQKYAVTILHESHKSMANFVQIYDQFTKIQEVKITIFDKNGRKVKTVKRSDIIDIPSFMDNTLFASIRQKVYEPNYYEYPFTVEYSYKKIYNGILNYPSYYALSSYDVSLEKGLFTVNVPLGKELRFHEMNINTKCSITENSEFKEYKWSFDNLSPIKNEDYDHWFSCLVPIVYIAPSDFEMDGYIGNTDTWEGLGKWRYSLKNGRDILPGSIKIELDEITKDAKTTNEKVKLVYEYMQSHTRYVNVVEGIGGWQPFPAMYVAENGYGDCKALSNYTFSLLKAIGIESIYTVIKAGDFVKEINMDFPSNQFNHVILCVPDGNDTIWLECTSQRSPFGYLGTFTDGRNALLVKENGSKLVKTPSLSIDDNSRFRKAEVNIDDDGNSTAIIEKKYQGYYYDNMRGIYFLEGKRRMDRVRNRIHIKNFVLNDADYKLSEHRSVHPYFTENYNVVADRYVKKLGNRLLFDVNFFNTEIDVPSSINKQESEIYIHRSISRIDSLEFIIPEGYFIKSFPKNDTIITNYGEFYTNFKVDGNKLCYTRKQLIRKGTFPSEEYSEFRSYLKKISMSDKQKVLVMPKE